MIFFFRSFLYSERNQKKTAKIYKSKSSFAKNTRLFFIASIWTVIFHSFFVDDYDFAKK